MARQQRGRPKHITTLLLDAAKAERLRATDQQQLRDIVDELEQRCIFTKQDFMSLLAAYDSVGEC